jgi:hypothetical protein
MKGVLQIFVLYMCVTLYLVSCGGEYDYHDSVKDKEIQPHPVLVGYYEWYQWNDLRITYKVMNVGDADMEWGDLSWAYELEFQDEIQEHTERIYDLPIGETACGTIVIEVEYRVIDCWYERTYFEPWVYADLR